MPRPADSRAIVAYLLGTAVPESSSERVPCILKVEKTPFAPGEASSLAARDVWQQLQTVRPPSLPLPSAHELTPSPAGHDERHLLDLARLVRTRPVHRRRPALVHLPRHRQGAPFPLALLLRGLELTLPPSCAQHIKKYSVQDSRLVRETPDLYECVVKAYMDSLPLSTVGWVYNILDGSAESENVLYRDDDPETGFVLTPDLCALSSSLLF